MDPKRRSFVLWLIVFVLAILLSFFLVNNKIELPFHDRARDVVSFNGNNQALDAQGNVVNNWKNNNYADDAIKIVVVAAAIFSYWKFISTFISKFWIKSLIIVVSVPTMVVTAYFISLSIYW